MAFFGPIVYVPSALLANPPDGTILCDSGPLSRGEWLLGVAGEADASIVYDIKLINAGTLVARRRPAAGDIDFLAPNQISVSQAEIVRVVIVGNPVATVQLTLFGLLIG